MTTVKPIKPVLSSRKRGRETNDSLDEHESQSQDVCSELLICVLCGGTGSLLNGRSIGAKGIDTILSNYHKLVTLGDFVHTTCYKKASDKRIKKPEFKSLFPLQDNQCAIAETASFISPSNMTQDLNRAKSRRGEKLKHKCIFCNCIEGVNYPIRREQLLPARTQISKDTNKVYNMALEMAGTMEPGISRILGTNPDWVSAEIHYHDSCRGLFKLAYKTFKESDSISSSMSRGRPKGTGFVSEQTKTAFDKAFPVFDQHLSQGAILTLYQIRNCVQEFAETGVEIKSNHLRPLLMNKYDIQDEAEMFQEKGFGNQTLVIPPNQGSARIIGDVLAGGLNSYLSVGDAAGKVRRQVLRYSYDSEFPYNLNDLINPNDDIPPLLYNLVAQLLYCEGSISQSKLNNVRCKVSHTAHKKIVNICEILIFAISHHHIKPPGIVENGLLIKYLSGSKTLLDMLASFGVTAGSADVKLQEKALIGGTFQSKDKHPMINFAFRHLYAYWFDNLDFKLRLRGSWHCTTGMACGTQERSADDGDGTKRMTQRDASEVKVKSIEICKSTMPGKKRIKGPTPLPTIEPPRTDELTLFFENFTLFHISRYYTIGKMSTDLEYAQGMPSFRAYCSRVIPDAAPSIIQYDNIITESPTNNNVVQSILLSKQDCSVNKHANDVAVNVVDGGIYPRCQDIKYNTEGLDKTINMIGGFHLDLNFISVIGKRCEGSGFRELTTDAQITYEHANLDNIIVGKNYSACVDLLEIWLEVLDRKEKKAFVLETGYDDNVVEEIVKSISYSTTDLPNALINLKENAKIQEYLYTMKKWRDEKTSRTFRFWNELVEMMRLRTAYNHSFRTKNWSLQLATLPLIGAYMSAYDRHIYTRQLLRFYVEMMVYSDQYPQFRQFLEDGGFAGSLTGLGGEAVPIDQLGEQSINRQAKESAGIRLKRQDDDLQEWAAVTPLISKIYEFRCGKEKRSHHTRQLELIKIEKTRRLEAEMNKCIDPFLFAGDELVNIYDGGKIENEVSDHVLRAKEIGTSVVNTCIIDRICGKDAETKFKERLKKNKIPSLLPHKKEHLFKEQKASLSDDFINATCLAQRMDIDMEYVMSFPLGDKPWSMVQPRTGAMAKTTKSLLSTILIQDNDEVKDDNMSPDLFSSSQVFDVVIIDGGMALQQMNSWTEVNLYEDVANGLWTVFVVNTKDKFKIKEVHIVPDKYWKISLKCFTREKRGANTRDIIIGEKTQTIVSIKEMLKNSSFKKQIWQFCLHLWCKTKKYCEINVKVYVGHQLLCDNAPTEIEELDVSGIEEADSIMLRHAAFAEKDGEKRIMFDFADRDVLVNVLWGCNHLHSKLFWRDRNCNKIFDLNRAASRQSRDVIEALPAFHCITGNDHNAALVYKGKATPLHKLLKCPLAIEAFGKLGMSEQIDDKVVPGIRQFILSLYSTSKLSITNCKTTNIARAKLILSGQKNAARLPMCEKVMVQHIKRTNLLTFIMKSPFYSSLKIVPDPIDHGYKLNQESTGYDIHWYEGESRPDMLITAVKSCKCKQENPCNEHCPCSMISLRCTLACACEGDCLNMISEIHTDSEDSDGVD